ncbi:radical SAM protein [Methanoplanus sp. FWC-SCC4]|uniref:Radical SAM protein n=1 Tax=Methanochimaera problematica TaxID=2609417 RepID=A0AA97FDQ6_9EURY|nr:radical SAM protein [Methanoplanus sp. FWC-SCC4]WOF16163.1 radical SAM protein [Methanoplanus sp. FWC-SCC4]
MVIKKTKGLCPECGAVLPADIIEEDNKIWIVRKCPEHGEFKHLYWSDADMYSRFDSFEAVGTGIENPNNCIVPQDCPTGCGLCNNHKSTTLLANIDLTNRCNLNCDFCFANARACGYVYEPSFDEIVSMLKMLREQKPCPAPAVQFAGGEPTMRDDLVEIIKKAKELGFKQIQMASNGVKLAKDRQYVMDLKCAGLSTLYLHFDGVSKETNPMINISKKVIENCSEVRQGIVLVPTIINGKNDHEVGDIIKFAAEHVDVVRGVNFQPVAFTGAASEDDVINERVTIPDLTKRIEEQTNGKIRQDYFYPVPCMIPVSDLVESYTGKPQIRFTTHQHCGAATYAFVTENGLVPVNEMIDVDEFFKVINIMADDLKNKGSLNKYLTLAEGLKGFHSSVKKSGSGKTGQFWKMLYQALLKQDFQALKEFHWNALFIGTMHFMDNYNYDVERVQRCCIHYATPDGKLIPFCTYNSGPVYRENVWKKFAKPMDKQDELADIN